MTTEEYLKRKLREELEREENNRLYREVKILHEGLIYSQSAEKTVSLLGKYFKIVGQTSYNFIEITTDNTIIIDLTPIAHNVDNIRSLLLTINNLGWFVSLIYYKKLLNPRIKDEKYSEEKLLEFIKNKNYTNLYIVLEAKFDRELDVGEIPEKLYHLSYQKHFNKIKEKGLIPKTKNKLSTHPERIFLALNIESVNKLYGQFKTKEPNETFTIWEIEIDKVPQLKLFDDPNYKGKGVYTLMNIPPNAIKIIKENI